MYTHVLNAQNMEAVDSLIDSSSLCRSAWLQEQSVPLKFFDSLTLQVKSCGHTQMLHRWNLNRYKTSPKSPSCVGKYTFLPWSCHGIGSILGFGGRLQ